jgi:Domain of unknown function (DUF4440)
MINSKERVAMMIWQRAAWLFVLAYLGATAAFAQVPSDLQQAMRERQKAIEAADATTWDRMTSNEFTLVNANGRFSTKAERLAALKQQKPQTTPTSRSQEQIRVYGNSAIERVRSGNSWVIQVWVKQPQGWQVVATQLTTAAQ